MDNAMKQQAQRIYENAPLPAVDFFAGIPRVRSSTGPRTGSAGRIDADPPPEPVEGFGALDALTIDDGGGGAGLSLGLLATLHVKCVVDILQRAVIGPQIEISVRSVLFGGRSFGIARH